MVTREVNWQEKPGYGKLKPLADEVWTTPLTWYGVQQQ